MLRPLLLRMQRRRSNFFESPPLSGLIDQTKTRRAIWFFCEYSSFVVLVNRLLTLLFLIAPPESPRRLAKRAGGLSKNNQNPHKNSPIAKSPKLRKARRKISWKNREFVRGLQPEKQNPSAHPPPFMTPIPNSRLQGGFRSPSKVRKPAKIRL